MFALAALVTHAQLLENVSGCWIMFEMRRKNAVQSKLLKSITQYCPRRLCRIPQPPIGNSQPVAKFGMLMLLVEAQANPANLPFVRAASDSQPQLPWLLHQFEERTCIFFGVRMRDAQRRGGDFPRSNQRQEFCSIRVLVRTNPQPLGFECRSMFHIQSARASAMPPSAPAKQSRLLAKMLTSIRSHWPCSKKDMLSNA